MIDHFKINAFHSICILYNARRFYQRQSLSLGQIALKPKMRKLRRRFARHPNAGIALRCVNNFKIAISCIIVQVDYKRYLINTRQKLCCLQTIKDTRDLTLSENHRDLMFVCSSLCATRLRTFLSPKSSSRSDIFLLAVLPLNRCRRQWRSRQGGGGMCRSSCNLYRQQGRSGGTGVAPLQRVRDVNVEIGSSATARPG